MRILALEPYYGGSHKAFLDGLVSHLPYDFDLLTMPAHSWKWRMRLAAPYFAGLLQDRAERVISEYDCIFCSSLLDVATFKGMLPVRLRALPIFCYFHENQFAYPVQVAEERDVHFALTNLTTALAADRLAFNSRYNLESFLCGARTLMAKVPDMRLAGFEDAVREKSTVLYPALDFSEFDAEYSCRGEGTLPVIVWNHRWEHDKNPDFFFRGLYSMAKNGISFQLIVLGKSFRSRPAVFAEAAEKLARQTVHFGHVESRREYCRLLRSADVVVSTALHEFYGIAVLEAVRSGCRPLVPDRLSYQEIFPESCRYRDGDFSGQLAEALERKRLTPGEAATLTERFSWTTQRSRYRQWFEISGESPA